MYDLNLLKFLIKAFIWNCPVNFIFIIILISSKFVSFIIHDNHFATSRCILFYFVSVFSLMAVSLNYQVWRSGVGILLSSF